MLGKNSAWQALGDGEQTRPARLSRFSFLPHPSDTST